MGHDLLSFGCRVLLSFKGGAAAVSTAVVSGHSQTRKHIVLAAGAANAPSRAAAFGMIVRLRTAESGLLQAACFSATSFSLAVATDGALLF